MDKVKPAAAAPPPALASPAETPDQTPRPDAATTKDGEPASASPDQTPPRAIAVDKSRPQDFEGELSTKSELPSRETLRRIDNYIVLDRHGRTHTFQSLYSGHNVARRVLVVFVRHFFCGNCQEYLRSLSESITPEALLQLSTSTFVAVVGCGDPGLIDMYAEATKCPFPIYTDPTRCLFDELGMVKTLDLGSKPAYMRKNMMTVILDSIGQALRFVPSGLALNSGDKRQVGGEFLFEPIDAAASVTTPRDEAVGSLQPPDQGHDEPVIAGPVEEKQVTWCHRMKTTRDHAGVAEIMQILGLGQVGEAGG